MAIFSAPQPEFSAHQRALCLPTPEVVQKLVEVIGLKLTAYVTGVKDTRAVDRWVAGGEIDGDAEKRLRFVLQLAYTLGKHDSPAVVQAWLTSVNPDLGDRVPLRVLREGNIDAVAPDVLRAAHAFVNGGYPRFADP